MQNKSTWIVLALSVGLLLFAVPLSSVMYTYAGVTASGNDGGKDSGKKDDKGSPSGNDGKRSSGGGSGSSGQSEPAKPVIINNNKVTASDGSVVTSSLPGSAVTEFIQVAATTDAQALKGQLGLTPAQEFNLTSYESGKTQSKAAWDSVQGAAQAFCDANNLTNVDFASRLLQVEMSTIEAGQKTVVTDNGATAVRLVLRDTAGHGGAKYANAVAIRVVEGGEVSILPDLDQDPNTVTIDAPLGNAAYLLMWY